MKIRIVTMIMACILTISLLMGVTPAADPQPQDTPPTHDCINTLTDVPEVPATCRTDGTSAYKVCSECQKKYDSNLMEFTDMSHVTIPAHHVSGGWEKGPYIPPTCKAPGSDSRVQHCENCHMKIAEELTPLEPSSLYHNPVQVAAVAASCETPGNEEYYVCQECGEWFLIDMVPLTDHSAVIIPASGHKAGAEVIENYTDPECNHKGSYDLVTYCENCPKELSRRTILVDELEHIAGEPGIENEVAASCKEEGSYDLVTRCTTCKAELTRETVPVNKKEHVADDPVKENIVAPVDFHDGSYEAVVYCKVCRLELSRTKELIPSMHRSAEEAARQAAEAARQAAEAARVAERGNIPFEPATTRPLEAPTRPAPAPVPVPAPQRPAAPAGIPSRPAAVNFEMVKIKNVDTFVDDLISELDKDGKTLALKTDTLKEVLNNISDPVQESMGVDKAVDALGGNIKTYRSNGKETADPELDEYHFLCSFEQLKLQSEQTVDRYGNPQPFEITALYPTLVDLKDEEISNTMMMVYDPESGMIALIQLNAADLNGSRELKVTIPFPGLYTFIQKG